MPPRKIFQITTLLADRYQTHTRTQALAWKRTVLEALPPEAFYPATIRQAEPAIHWVPRQSLGTSWWRSARSVIFTSIYMHMNRPRFFVGIGYFAEPNAIDH